MKLDNLQVLRAIAAYAVVLVHVEDIEAKRFDGRILGDWANAGLWGVDLFFVISGFVMVLVSQNTLGSARDAGKFLWSRATRIYPLWWICLSALVPIWLFRPELVYGGTQHEINFLKDYLLIPKSESPLLQTGWTLIHEMYFYIVFAALLLVPLGGQRRILLIAVWGLLAVGAGFLLNPSKGDAPVLRLITSPMTLEFVAGAFAAYFWQATRGAMGATALIAGVVALALGFFGDLNDTLSGLATSGVNPDWERVILFLPGAALLTYGAASVELRRGWKVTGPFVKLGDWSYSLYLTHMLSANAIGVAWGAFAVPGLVDNVFGLAAVLGGCTLVGWLSFRFLEQPVIRAAKSMSGKLFA